jgi:hypothetical protein
VWLCAQAGITHGDDFYGNPFCDGVAADLSSLPGLSDGRVLGMVREVLWFHSHVLCGVVVRDMLELACRYVARSANEYRKVPPV